MPSVKYIIHGAATAAGAAGASMAQFPGGDAAVITPIQVSMIIAIAEHYGISMKKSVALGILTSASASIAGRTASQFLVGWIPGIGNAINATTAASITEAIGWSADKLLSERREN